MNDTLLNEWNVTSAKLQQRLDLEELAAEADYDDVINELESRGIVLSRNPRWIRFAWIAKAPLRFVSRILGKIVWHLYAKKQHERAIQKTIEQWKRNAGLTPGSNSSVKYLTPDEKLIRWGKFHALLSTKPSTNSVARAIHDEIIRSTVHKLPLPPPDVDDFVPAIDRRLSESDMRLPLTTSTVPPKE